MNTLAIDYGTKTIGLAHYNGSIALPLGNIDNDGDMWFNIMGIVAQHNIATIIVGFPKNTDMQTIINKFINTLQYMFEWTITKIDENYTSVQAQAITESTGKHIANDTLAAMELINRYLAQQ